MKSFTYSKGAAVALGSIAIIEMGNVMRRLVGAIFGATLLLGCSAQGSMHQDLPPVAEPSQPLASAGRSPLEVRPLVDLRKKVKKKGKVVLFHMENKAKQAYWTTEVGLGAAFKVAVDCVGSRENLVIHADGAFHFNRQCNTGYTTYTVDDYPPAPIKMYKVTVEAPHGAKWAILVTRLHRKNS